LHYMERRNAPYAFLVRRQTFTPYKLQNNREKQGQDSIAKQLSMNRETAIQTIIQRLDQWDIVVSTTGFTSRELYEYRATTDNAAIQGHKRDFLCVGSMGHANTIGLGIAINKPSRQTIVLDGDGACIMHMGNLSTIGQTDGIENYKHILINNGSHDSVGGQPTSGFSIDFLSIAKNCGYKWVKRVTTQEDLKNAVNELRQVQG
jgi:phosphonopyruvate decarboxylase